MCFLYKMTIALKTKAETEKISAFVFENSRQNKENFFSENVNDAFPS